MKKRSFWLLPTVTLLATCWSLNSTGCFFSDKVEDGTYELNDQGSADVFGAVAKSLKERRTRPLATYRMQMHPAAAKDFVDQPVGAFGFAEAAALIPYLRDLGASPYFSPILTPTQGSQHGYDVVDPTNVNPELGPWATVESAMQTWKGQVNPKAANAPFRLIDIVPNHMGVEVNNNAWWNDVLENGPSSPYNRYFDINWETKTEGLQNAVALPILGNDIDDAIAEGNVDVFFDAPKGAFFLRTYARYGGRYLPLDPKTSIDILETVAAGLAGSSKAAVELVITTLRGMPDYTDTSKADDRLKAINNVKTALQREASSSSEFTEKMGKALAALNADENRQKNGPLKQLAERQVYRLRDWRVAGSMINYRRFFDVNGLAALKQEDLDVFEATHKKTIELIAQSNVMSGLRIDHPDGLWNPKEYFFNLQKKYVVELCKQEYARRHSGASASDKQIQDYGTIYTSHARSGSPYDAELKKPLYIVAEKILSHGEKIPSDWLIDGTTGYEFAELVNRLLVDSTSQQAFDNIYESFSGFSSLHENGYKQLTYDKRKDPTLRVALESQVGLLVSSICKYAGVNYCTYASEEPNKDTLKSVLASFPVYRTYVTEDSGPVGDGAINAAFAEARRQDPDGNPSFYQTLRNILSENPQFVMQMQQLTPATMAIGIENTSFYVYNRLVSLNEVGGHPDLFGAKVFSSDPAEESFHHVNEERQAKWPDTMILTSTHDTKRSEDTRARISVLSQMPDEWNAALKQLEGRGGPTYSDRTQQQQADKNFAYFLYQNIVGTLPLKNEGREVDMASFETYRRRLQAFANKSIREAKEHTNHINNNQPEKEQYEKNVKAFVNTALSPDSLKALLSVTEKAAYHGMWNSLTQTLLKLTSPGVPDIYQGQELWDYSLVDPDNRRPVDFDLRRRYLAEMTSHVGQREYASTLLQSGTGDQAQITAYDGRIKMFVTYMALQTRQHHPKLFESGSTYQGLQVRGDKSDFVVAFSRRNDKKRMITVVPRFTAKLVGGQKQPPVGEAWQGNSCLDVGTEEASIVNVLTGESISTQQYNGCIPLAKVFEEFPVALFAPPWWDGCN